MGNSPSIENMTRQDAREFASIIEQRQTEIKGDLITLRRGSTDELDLMLTFYSKCIKRSNLLHAINPGPCDEAAKALARALYLNVQTAEMDKALQQIDEIIEQNRR